MPVFYGEIIDIVNYFYLDKLFVSDMLNTLTHWDRVIHL